MLIWSGMTIRREVISLQSHESDPLLDRVSNPSVLNRDGNVIAPAQIDVELGAEPLVRKLDPDSCRLPGHRDRGDLLGEAIELCRGHGVLVEHLAAIDR